MMQQLGAFTCPRDGTNNLDFIAIYDDDGPRALVCPVCYADKIPLPAYVPALLDVQRFLKAAQGDKSCYRHTSGTFEDFASRVKWHLGRKTRQLGQAATSPMTPMRLCLMASMAFLGAFLMITASKTEKSSLK